MLNDSSGVTIELWGSADELDEFERALGSGPPLARIDSFERGTDAEVTVERQVFMRYRGQGWEIPVTLPGGRFDVVAADALETEFTKAYETFFGRAIADLTIETVSWSVRVSSVREHPPRVQPVAPEAEHG